MAAGDISLTTPINKVVVSGFSVRDLNISLKNAKMEVVFEEPTGDIHTVRLNDTSCLGFGISGSVVTDDIPRAVSGEYTKLLGILFGAGANTPNQRRTAAINALVTDGIITVVGTVG